MFAGPPGLKTEAEVLGMELHSAMLYSTIQKLEYGPWMIYAGFSASLSFGVPGSSYSNFLTSTAIPVNRRALKSKSRSRSLVF